MQICDPIDIIFKKSFHQSPNLIELDINDFFISNNDNILYTFGLDFKKVDMMGLNIYIFSLDWTDFFS